VRVLVTGAAAGIGAATARRFAAGGAEVVGLDAVEAATPCVRHVVGDVTDPASLLEAIGDEALDVCVANAGISLMDDFLAGGDPGAWERVVRVNLLGVMSTFQAAARSMVDGGKPGRLLATASIAGLHGEPGSAAYCASKAGVIGLVKTLAVELAAHGITVNAVAPGQIDTAMNSRDLETVSRAAGRPAGELLRDHLDSRVPAGRLGRADEVAALFAYLASPEAAFINGEVIRIDGGELAS
jgi:NAD(P)-dependent dehydrogenase (short-subunit alcohol dehydrogenase family)